MGLNKELWLPFLIGDKDEFWENDRFLSHGRNMNAFVNNDKLHFTYKGGRPTGWTKNFTTNGTTELPVFMRTDIPDNIELDSLSSPQLVLPSDDKLLLPYDKKSSMMEDNRLELVNQIATEGIWNVSPAANTANTPVFTVAAGNAVDPDDSYKVITRTDLVKARKILDKKYPGMKKRKWWVMMDVDAYWNLIENDDILKAQNQHLIGYGKALPADELPILMVAGFFIYCDQRTAWYDNTNSTKLAYGSTPTVGTHYKSALIYRENESFITALGSTEFFGQDKHPGKQADLWSLRTRYNVSNWGVTPANFKMVGAILRTP